MKIIKFLFSPAFTGIFFVVFALSMAAATFIENDFGSAASYNLVYNARWFELILILLSANLIGQIIIHRLFRRDKLPVALFHLSFVLMVAGAGITRYFGWEGSIHIREGETSSVCYSSGKYVGYSVRDKNGSVIDRHSGRYTMTSLTAGNYRRNISLNNKKYELVLSRIIPNAEETITDVPEGLPLVSLAISNSTGSRENIILKKGESKNILGVSIGFSAPVRTDIDINADSGRFSVSSGNELKQMSMMSQGTRTLKPGERLAMKPLQILTFRDIMIVPRQMSFVGTVTAVAVDPEQQETGRNAFIFDVNAGGKSETVCLWDSDWQPAESGACNLDGYRFEITYGSKEVTLPFSLRLNDFILERYPGSSSPSGYKSNVTLIDKAAKVEKPFMIFMNNILNYKGYRFYQSSFDKDEKGTMLSVNHDPGGILVTYTGYAFLFLFIILSLISRNSRFRTIKASAWSSPLRKGIAALLFFMIISGFSAIDAQKFIPGREGSEEFGKVLVQDQKGRTKPLYTLSNDILRKVSRESKFEGNTSMQVFLGLYFDFDHWKDVPLIRVSDADIRKSLGITGNMASFSDLVDINGKETYKLSRQVNAAYEKSPAQRNKFDKEVMKVDERVNIIYMIYKGDFMKIFPLKDGSHKWGTYEDAITTAGSRKDSLYLQKVMPLLAESLQTNNSITSRQITESVIGYQKKYAEYALPSASKTNAEVTYYKLSIFEKLFPFYAIIGVVMLLGLIFMVIKGKTKTSLFIKALGWMLFAGFLFHTAGLALRWYIAGHSPMTNGYESLIFISWVTLLAGFVFSRRSAFSLSATAVLAGMTLMVAHLSFMDPEITNLVPVLRSYWLTLHVSVITGSYGFLGLGAILSIIIMILLLLSNPENRDRISNTIDELTVINFKTLTLGLCFITIGTFLGAVWANESWGRYWGWDPKETWSLITIIVYAFVIHSGMMPGMKSIYTFNLLSLWGFSSVLMTYFGVNYYLSGMHSYATGEPVGVPFFVYFAIAVLAGLCVAAYKKYRKFEKASGDNK
ncbi:MAG: cytochrome c biogenesis protein CcsA [Bacteroidales bacterium]